VKFHKIPHKILQNHIKELIAFAISPLKFLIVTGIVPVFV